MCLGLHVFRVSHIHVFLRNEPAVGLLDAFEPIVGKPLNFQVGLGVLEIRVQLRNLDSRQHLSLLDRIALIDAD